MRSEFTRVASGKYSVGMQLCSSYVGVEPLSILLVFKWIINITTAVRDFSVAHKRPFVSIGCTTIPPRI